MLLNRSQNGGGSFVSQPHRFFFAILHHKPFGGDRRDRRGTAPVVICVAHFFLEPDFRVSPAYATDEPPTCIPLLEIAGLVC
ncbi:MAG: hypothetical protein CMJ81_16065 [Planctomycetaceae bacterium]|nr:hypothetical protein [Planctomycetaceae bacterium]MBP62257.1 hypothetical protein [Planctomycetaceae bacterium]